MGYLQTSRLIPAPCKDVYRFITDLSNLPEWVGERMEVEFPVAPPTPLVEMAEFEVDFSRFGFSVRVQAKVEELREGERFRYRQTSGFFKNWEHTQTLLAHGDQTTLITDLVDYRMPWGVVGAMLDDVLVHRDLENLLKERLVRIEEYFLSRPTST